MGVAASGDVAASGGVAAGIQATARLAAAGRAAETRQPRPRLRDDYAHLFTGELPAGHRRLLAAGGQEVIARTALIDELLLDAIGRFDTPVVVNLGAGYCARPYRMDLSACRLVVELDAAEIVDEKERSLGPYRPTCPVRRLALDLRDRPALATRLAEPDIAGQPTILITEGLLPYLPPGALAGLAATLATATGDGVWLTDLVSTASARAMGQLAAEAGLVLDLYGLPDLEPFEANGWTCADYRILPIAARAPISGPQSSRDVVDGVVALIPTDRRTDDVERAPDRRSGT